MDLDSLKYADLRQLAKSAGLKANMKADKLLKALKTHFEQLESSENANVADSDAQAVDESGPSEAVFVTKRRGKGQNGKRKHSENEVVESESKPVESPTPDNAKLAEAQDGKSSSKRRKVSSSKDMEPPASSEVPQKSKQKNTPQSVKNDAANKSIEKGPGKTKAGKIPRHEGLMKKKAALRPTTPNFKKLHEAHFSKMESIDSYVQRKNKQMEVLRNTVKELKDQSEDTVKNAADKESQTKPPAGRASLFSPGVQEKKPAAQKRRFTQVTATKPAVKDSAPFRPTVLSAKKINVRFSQATQDNEHKRSLIKTPARMSPMFPLTPTPGRNSVTKPENKNTVNKTTAAIPFVFNGTSTTPGNNKRNTFDLKASLSRPLTYKPYKGKLKPFVNNQENTALNKSQTMSSHKKNYKQHQVQTRDARRHQHAEERKQKKDKMLGARRGLVMA